MIIWMMQYSCLFVFFFSVTTVPGSEGHQPVPVHCIGKSCELVCVWNNEEVFVGHKKSFFTPWRDFFFFSQFLLSILWQVTLNFNQLGTVQLRKFKVQENHDCLWLHLAILCSKPSYFFTNNCQMLPYPNLCYTLYLLNCTLQLHRNRGM